MTINRGSSQLIVAAFDFDGTLTRRDSMFPFLLFVVGIRKFTIFLILLGPLFIKYFLGVVDRQKAKEAVLKKFLGGLDKAKLHRYGENFSNQVLFKLLRQDSLARLRWHQQQGHPCVVISASLDVYLEPWGRSMGFHTVLSSKLEYDTNDCATGKLVGVNCHGFEKVNRLRQLFSQPIELYAYGDSLGDHELLAMSDHPYYKKMPVSGEC